MKKNFEGPLKPGRPGQQPKRPRLPDPNPDRIRVPRSPITNPRDLLPPSIASEKSLFDEFVNELRTGPLSILSEKALERLILLFQAGQRDAYDRGVVAGRAFVA